MAKRRKRKRPSSRRPVLPRIDIGEFFRNIGDFFLRRKSLMVIAALIIILPIAALIGLKYISDNYTVTNVYVTGNTHYTNEEIMEMVMDGRFGHNSVYLSMKYRNKSIEDIPFIQKMSVEILSPDTIRINVYEKAIAGYIQYLGRYMYFDRDGIVVESSQESSNDVPLVLGLSFDHVIIHEKLPVENESVFAEILDITKLLSKYELHAEKIFFDSDYDVYLYFGDVEVSIGTRDCIDEKIIQLQYILPSLEGKSGILEMKDYDEDTTNITFEEKSR